MIPLIQPNEIKIDTWSILYIPPGGGKYHGKLTITNKRLLYDAKNGLPVNGFLTEGLEINKTDIMDIHVEKNILAKKVILVLSDGSRHTFSYGALNIDKVVEAIRSS
jgi:hypothetical protein